MKYKFVGNGACIPGLPHEISQAEIDQFNPEQMKIWNAALSSGAYIEVVDEPAEKPARVRKTKSPEIAGEGE